MMEEKNANEVAKKLGISKRTLFRRLADARNLEQNIFFDSTIRHVDVGRKTMGFAMPVAMQITIRYMTYFFTK